MTEKTMSPAGRPFPTPYVMIWALLATLSLVYLTVLAMEPSLVTEYFGSSPVTATPQSNQGQRAATDAVAEIKSLRESVGQVRGDIEQLRAEVSGRAERERDLDTRLAALEAGPADATKRVAEGPAASPGATGKAAETMAAKSVHPGVGDAETAGQKAVAPAGVVLLTGKSPAEPEAAPVKVAAVNGSAGKAPADAPSLETGSVEAVNAPPVKFGPATVIPTAKPVGLEIATGPSLDSLRLNWALLADRHGDRLSALKPRYTKSVDSSGVTFALIVGPVSSTAEAKRMCKELGQKGTLCKVGDFVGEAL